MAIDSLRKVERRQRLSPNCQLVVKKARPEPGVSDAEQKIMGISGCDGDSNSTLLKSVSQKNIPQKLEVPMYKHQVLLLRRELKGTEVMEADWEQMRLARTSGS